MKNGRFVVLFTLLVLLLIPVGCASETTPADPTALPYASDAADTQLGQLAPASQEEGDPVAGERVFQLHCQNCHSTDETVIAVGPSLFGAGDRLQLKYIFDSLENPHQMRSAVYDLDMPPELAQQLAPKELRDVVAFVSSLRIEEQ
jgi:mono/diheme cytochrome c family protein